MKIKRIISALLAAVMMFGIGSVVSAQEEEGSPVSGTLKLMDMNVDGLPVPAGLSKDNKSPIKSAASIIDMINAEDPDIVTTQENFNFFPMYKAKLNYSNISSYNGGAAVGDGLAVASKYKLYNVRHIAWKDACGVLNCGSDQLTPKGFMVATIQIAPGAYIDIYTLHADACEDEGSLQAKRDQFQQLDKFIESYSADRAVIIAGDFNSNYTIVLPEELRTHFVDKGFKDTWIETENGGDYFPEYSQMYEKYGTPYWGHWDCLDKMYYRDGANVKLNVTSHKYQFCYTENQDGQSVTASDHAAIISEIEYIITDDSACEISLVSENATTVFDLIIRAAKTVFNDIILLIGQLPGVISGEIKLDWMK